MSYVMTTYGAISTGAIQIVTPETLNGVGGQALNDNFKRIRDAVHTLETTVGTYGNVVTHNTSEFMLASSLSGYLQAGLNLSDLLSPVTARASLGLGTIATHAAGDFTLVANNLSELTATAATARTNLGLGTISTHAETDYLLAANNLSDIGDATTARTNLGIGDVATHGAADFAAVANNLSDLADFPTARTNLGLGDSSTHPTSDFCQTANNLSDLADASTARTNLGIGGGWSGTYATGDGRTVTVANGSINDVS